MFSMIATTSVTYSRPSGPPQERPGHHKAPMYTNLQRILKVRIFTRKQKNSAYMMILEDLSGDKQKVAEINKKLHLSLGWFRIRRQNTPS